MVRMTGWVLAAALTLSAASAAAEQASKSVKDWTANCDASGNCAATTAVGAETEGYVARHILRIARSAGANATWTISIATIAALADRDRPAEIRVDDNAPITLRPQSDYAPYGAVNDFFIVGRGVLKALFPQMIGGGELRFTFLDIGAAPHDVDFSLAGLAATLLWIDERQDRLKSPRVAAAPSDLKPAPMVDKSLAVARLGVPPRLMHLHRSASTCEDPNSQHMSGFQPVIAPLSKTAMLYAIPCTAGAYNIGYRLYIVESGEIGGIEPLYFAAFTDSHGWSGSDILFNISYDADTKRLSSFYKGRGLGDCGNAGIWVWKKYAFAMRSFRSWSRCDGTRGPDKWPSAFRAKP